MGPDRTSFRQLSWAVATVIILAGTTVLVLTYLKWRSAAQSRERAEIAVHEVASNWLRDFAFLAEIGSVRTAEAAFDAVRSNQGGVLDTMLALVESPPAGCSCHGMESATALISGTEGVVVRSRGAAPTTSPVLDALIDLADTLPVDPPHTHSGALAVGAQQWIAFYSRRVSRASGDTVILGLLVDLPTFGRTALRAALEEQRRAYWRGAPGFDSIFTVEVRSTVDSSAVLAPDLDVVDRYSEVRRFWGDEDDKLVARLTVNPDRIAAFMPGGVPDMPVVSTVVTLLLTLVLGLTGVWLLIRMSEFVRMREEFTAGVSHELRTPLTQILLYGEMLQLDRASEAKRARAAAIIVREARRLVRMVENTMTFVRGQRPAPTLEMRACDLGAVVQETAEDMTPIADRRGQTVEVIVEGDTRIWADADAMRQVVGNLVENALRYGPEEDVVIVKVRGGTHVTLTITDRGRGIPVDQRDRVWSPFVRLNPASEPGSGIGLAVVRQLVELHGGRATMEDSEDGVGLCVVVTLPRSHDSVSVAETV